MDSKNYCIILAGGIGSKLWPMSTAAMPKQFLTLFSTGRTMLQMTYDRCAKVIDPKNICVSTFKDYVDIVKEQLPEIDPQNIIAEPLQISTAPATALTLMHIIGRNPEANIISTPADHLIFDTAAFVEQVEKGLKFVDETDNFLAIGIKPTRPATSYGYLQAGMEQKDGFLRLKSFTEKPDIDFANLFCESGEFYWNTGIFMWNAKTMLRAIKEDYPEIEKLASMSGSCIDADDVVQMISDQYPRIRFQTVDMLILEHNFNVYIAPSTFGWADVGSWKNYYDLQQKDRNGNVMSDTRHLIYSSRNNLFRTIPGKVVIAQGLEGYMVVENDKVLMICKKDDPAFIRRIVNDAQMTFGDEVM